MRLERSAPDYGDYTFTFHVENLQSGGQADLQLRNETTEIDDLAVYKNLLVVLGGVGTSADIVSIFDMTSGKFLKSFLCWWPQMSATGRYVAAVRFYPRFSAAPATSHVVVVYDLDELVSIPGKPPKVPAEPEPIYPPGAVAAGSTSGSWVEDELKRHGVDPVGFLWESRDRRVVFLDRTEKRTFVVAVDLGKQLITQRQLVDISPLLSLPKDSPQYARLLDDEQARFPVGSLRWLADGKNVGITVNRQRSANAGVYRRDVELLLVVRLESEYEESNWLEALPEHATCTPSSSPN
jgi:hypothetical protein